MREFVREVRENMAPLTSMTIRQACATKGKDGSIFDIKDKKIVVTDKIDEKNKAPEILPTGYGKVRGTVIYFFFELSDIICGVLRHKSQV